MSHALTRPFTAAIRRFLVTVLAIGLPVALTAQSFGFFGTYWETRIGRSYEAVGLGIPASDMQAAFEVHADDGYEMTALDAYDQGGDAYFNFVFRTRTSSAWTARWGMSGAGYQEFFDAQTGLGRCLRSLDIYRRGDRLRYAAVFKSHQCRAQRAYHGLSAAEHQDRFDAWSADGWAPVNVSVVTVNNGERRYAAFYERRPGGFLARSFLTRDQLAEEDATQRAAGRHIVYLNAYTHDQGQLPRFAAIWRPVSEPHEAWANIGGPQVTELGDEMHQSGRYVRYLTGYGVGTGHRYDLAVIRAVRAVDGPSSLRD